MANYSFGLRPIPDVENGHTFTGDNFCQLLPHTPILVGKTGIKFIKCNLVNCNIPVDAIKESCGHWHESFCTNMNPKLIEYGQTACAVNCTHVTQVDTITIDGVMVDTHYIYESKAVI